MNFTFLHFDTLESTNDEASRQARLGAQEGLCVIARQQTRGRGRYGRQWFSPMDAGLYFSLILRPKLTAEKIPLITLMSAVAVHDSLESLYLLECDIKWVNDILIKDKKICGILAETVETSLGLAVVVGIGINLTKQSVQPELSDVATSIESETGKKPDKNALVSSLTANLEKFYLMLLAEKGDEEICKCWTERSSYAFGKRIKARVSGHTIEGVTKGIDKNGALILRTDLGDVQTITAGEIEQLRQV
ncbi:MAG: biotin--[acetyl-CoA-carboxylase] ligase [Pyrinomonadaceae bacterium]|nr:biotin--[acetyl-CoA-carboxylase] ligase [Pyrinomonadaceae bacterium]MCX7639527.1 biotin--[acetyl-CoA-carboxylase] ligase [Pyrinomonadaceae bacterium]MDW8304422.1 biotin--[acetyl-CoA-carboxylase] ligase [Acidobacteriota bacterium]